MTEQIRLINECRASGLSDAEWCRQNGIVVSTFYNWIKRCRCAAADQVPAPTYGHITEVQQQPDIVPVSIVPDNVERQCPTASTHLDNSHTIEICMDSLQIRFTNEADPVLLSRTLRILHELSC